MGGINCDKSDGRRMDRHAFRSDSDNYNRVLAIYSKSLFEGYSSFLDVQAQIENVVVFDDLFKEVVNSQYDCLNGSIANYNYKIESLIKNIYYLDEAAKKNFYHKEVLSYMENTYKKESNEKLFEIAVKENLIPNNKELFDEVISHLSNGAELSLIKLFKQIAYDIKELNNKLSLSIKETNMSKSNKEFQLKIRVLDSSIAPFSMKSQTLWLKLSSIQSIWALMNMHSFPSIDGVNTPIDLIISSAK